MAAVVHWHGRHYMTACHSSVVGSSRMTVYYSTAHRHGIGRHVPVPVALWASQDVALYIMTSVSCCAVLCPLHTQHGILFLCEHERLMPVAAAFGSCNAGSCTAVPMGVSSGWSVCLVMWIKAKG